MNNITAKNSVDILIADFNSILTYTVVLTNSSSISANNINLLCNTSNGVKFVDGSLRIDGVSNSKANPLNMCEIGELPSKHTITIKYEMMVTGVDNIENSCSFCYEYNNAIQQVISNKVITEIKNATIVSEISANEKTTLYGEVLTYTVTLKNIGNSKATDVIFKDNLHSNLVFLPDTVAINGKNKNNENPVKGIVLDDIEPNNTVKISFNVIVNTHEQQPIKNRAEIMYKDAGTKIAKISKSNYAIVKLNFVYINVIERNYYKARYDHNHDIITYIINIANDGDVIAQNSVLKATFIPELPIQSVTLNGIDQNVDEINKGLKLPDIHPKATFVLNFNLIIENDTKIPFISTNSSVSSDFILFNDELMTSTFNSNWVSNKLKDNELELPVKLVNHSVEQVGENLIYKINLNNNSNYDYNNLFVEENMYFPLNFVNLSIDGILQPIEDIYHNISLGSLKSGEIKEIEINTKITEELPVPLDIINNSATIWGDGNFENTKSNKEFKIGTNMVSTYVPRFMLSVVAALGQSSAGIGQIVPCLIIVKNIGNFSGNNVKIKCDLPKNLKVVPNSIKVNNIAITKSNLETGINLEDIYAQGVSNLTFNIEVLEDTLSKKVSFNVEAIGNFQILQDEPMQSKTFSSNILELNIVNSKINIVEFADKNLLNLNDNIKYTILVSNNSDVEAKNIFLKDILPKELNFITGTVQVGAEKKIEANPNAGFSIGDIAIGGIQSIEFSAKVTKLPKTFLKNRSKVYYQYALGQNEPLINDSELGNVLVTQVDYVELKGSKSVDKEFADIEDILTYNIKLINSGNVVADNVTITDILPANIEFLKKSLKVNNKIYENIDITKGFNIGNINPEEIIIISFKVKVIDIVPSKITNGAKIEYKYNTNSNGLLGYKTFNTNNVTTTIKCANVLMKKTVSPTVATLNYKLDYTINIQNKGNEKATNVFLKDVIPEETKFDIDTVTINGILHRGINPIDGFKLKDIDVDENIIVKFSVVVINLSKKTISNQANLSFKYIVNPFKKPISKNIKSNIVFTSIKYAELTALETVNKDYADPKEILTYTTIIRNKGNVAANIYFKDILPLDSTFIDKSIIINGIKKLDFNPNVGFNIENIDVDETIKVCFKVKVGLLEKAILKNHANIKYSYTIDADKPKNKLSESIKSNEVVTKIMGRPKLDLIDVVNMNYADLGGILNYTINVKNYGDGNANNVKCMIKLTSNLAIMEDSLKIHINSNTIKDEDFKYIISNINSSMILIQIQSILSKDIITLKFAAKVINLIGENALDECTITFDEKRIQAEAKTTLKNGKIVLEQFVDKEIVKINEELTYKVIFTNTGITPCIDLIFKTFLPSCLEFIRNSFMVENSIIKEANPITGVYLNELFPGESRELNFKLKVLNTKQYTITDQSLILYKFIKNPFKKAISKMAYGNSVTSNIEANEVSIIKSSDKKIANPGEIITFTVLINNNRNETAMNVKFIDILAENLEFISGSFQVNDNVLLKANIKRGILIGNIESLGNATIKFKARVKYSIRPPRICNVAYGSVYYSELNKELQFVSNICRVIIGPIKFYKFGSTIVHYLP